LFRELSHQGRDFFLQGDYETALGVKQSDLFHALKKINNDNAIVLLKTGEHRK
jgi:hypothetical protein